MAERLKVKVLTQDERTVDKFIVCYVKGFSGRTVKEVMSIIEKQLQVFGVKEKTKPIRLKRLETIDGYALYPDNLVDTMIFDGDEVVAVSTGYEHKAPSNSFNPFDLVTSRGKKEIQLAARVYLSLTAF